MKRDWWLASVMNKDVGSKSSVLCALLEERYPDLPSLAFNRLVTGQTFFFDTTFSRRRSQFSEERIFCALLYLNRFLLGLPPMASVPLHHLERELYESRVLAFAPEGVSLQIVEQERLETSSVK